MARRNTNLIILIALIGGLLIFGYVMMAKKKENLDLPIEENPISHSDDVQFVDALPEFSHNTFENNENLGDDPEFVDVDPETGYNAADLSVGVGPGLWGSGRHTSELYGN